MKIYSLTDTGAVRRNNQDAFAHGTISDSLSWAVVCDGMGGANGGDYASRTAVGVLSNVITRGLTDDKNEIDIPQLLMSAITAANISVYEASKMEPQLAGMGTTVVAVVAKNNDITIAHAGDSRAYVIDSSGIRQITTDHSLVQEMVDSGEITEDEARVHPRKNIITRALGVTDEIEIDLNTCVLEDDSTVLICSDGLTNFVEDARIKEIIDSLREDEVPKALVDEANENGGGDNITAVIMCRRSGKEG